MFSSSSLSFVHSTEEIGTLPLPLAMVVDVGEVGGASLVLLILESKSDPVTPCVDCSKLKSRMARFKIRAPFFLPAHPFFF
jgi:hypothetical protein